MRWERGMTICLPHSWSRVAMGMGVATDLSLRRMSLAWRWHRLTVRIATYRRQWLFGNNVDRLCWSRECDRHGGCVELLCLQATSVSRLDERCGMLRIKIFSC